MLSASGYSSVGNMVSPCHQGAPDLLEDKDDPKSVRVEFMKGREDSFSWVLKSEQVSRFSGRLRKPEALQGQASALKSRLVGPLGLHCKATNENNYNL